jgi:BASS family bile acid:Na+ symporter
MLDLLFQNIDFLIDLVLAFITMSLGLNLSKEDFRQTFSNPRALTIGLAAQMIVLPLFTFAMMQASDYSPEIKVGFIIISLCPGGVTSNLVSYLLKGNVALSISLTVANGILCLFSVPLLVNMALNYFFHHTIPFTVFSTIIHIALVTIVPAVIGMLIRSRFPKIADTLRPILKYLLPAMLLTIFLIKIFAPSDKGGIALKQAEIMDFGVSALALNFSGMFIGFIIGTISRLSVNSRVTIMVEVGLHNTALALLLAGNILGNPEMQKPAMVYAMFTFFSTWLFGWLIRTLFLKYFEKNKA